MKELIFRLLKENDIVGYMKYMSPKMIFFSKDLYGWSAGEISYDDKDTHIHLKDKNQQLLFENDLFKHRHYPDSIFIVAQADYDEDSKIYQLIDNQITIPTVDMYQEQAHMIHFYAYLKDNPVLKDQVDNFKS